MGHDTNIDINKILFILRLRANNVYEKIVERMPEYLDDFAKKRTRKYFPEVFFHNFCSINIETLSLADVDTIISLENYFNKVDDLKWYMEHTEEMPKRVEDHLLHERKELSKLLETLNLFIDVQLELNQQQEKTLKQV